MPFPFQRHFDEFSGLGLALFPAFGQPWMYVLLTTAGLGLGVFCVSSMAFLNQAVPDSLKGTVSGAYYLSWGAGYFLGPLAAGRMSTSVGFEAVFRLLAALLVLESGALALAQWRERERGVNSPQVLILASTTRYKARNPPGEEGLLLFGSGARIRT